MFITLLLVILAVAVVVSYITGLLFTKPILKILSRLVSDELAPTWHRYLIFAIYVVGISGGVRLWEMEKYIDPDKLGRIMELNSDRWMIEVYKTIIGSLQGVAWMLLVFFLFALIAYVVVKGFEMKQSVNKADKFSMIGQPPSTPKNEKQS
jgi:hypothetical protein